MKVILLKDIENLGKKGEVKEVANGYGRNFLLRNKLAKLATKSALIELEEKRKLEAKKAEEELKIIQEIASRVDGQEIEIFVKVKEDDKIYGSITPLKISQALKKRGFNITKGQIKLEEPIKKLGEYPVIVTFDHGLEAEIKLIITEEKELSRN